MVRSKSLIVLICSVIAVIVAAVAVLFLLPDGSKKNTEVYTEKLNSAIRLYNSGEFDDAIKYFEEVIKLDPTNKTAYESLGFAYYNTSNFDMARDAWTRGFNATGLESFKTLISDYLDSRNAVNTAENGTDSGSTANVSAEAKLEGSSKLNYSFLTDLGKYTYEDYVSHYGAASVKNIVNGVEIKHNSFGGRFVYTVDSEGTSKIGNDGFPMPKAVPDAIYLDDYKQIFNGFEGLVNYGDLGKLGLIGLRNTEHLVRFKYGQCEVYIACNDNGDLDLESVSNKIVPEQKTELSEGEKKSFVVDIVLATTGENVSKPYTVEIAKSENVRSTDNSPFGANDEIETSVTVTNGVLDVELGYGDYVVCVYPEDDQSNFTRYNWKIDESTRDIDLKLVVTEKLEAGKIVIVLRWGDTPRDIDAHLIGQGKHIYYVNKTERGIELDVDCMTGNGIETITIDDSSGEYHYYVNNYSQEEPMGERSGATVEVFVGGSNVPQTFTIPSDIRRVWDVFTIKDGEIIAINTESDLDLY